MTTTMMMSDGCSTRTPPLPPPRSPIRTEYKVAFPYLYNNRPRKVRDLFAASGGTRHTQHLPGGGDVGYGGGGPAR